jgi:hypothetical protein
MKSTNRRKCAVPIRDIRPLIIVVLALVVASCGGPVKELDGALTKIPIFSPATLKERSTAHTSDVISDPMKFSTYTWHLETTMAPVVVDSFYSAQWPAAARVEEDGEIHFHNPPLPEGDAPLGEGVHVTIHPASADGKTHFEISEDVFSRRRS